MTSKTGRIDGQNILYHYLQKNTLREDSEFSTELLKRLLIDLSIWIPPDFYQRLPIILPYVVRDPSCRIRREIGEDEWGTANSEGFLRDDNSLIKGIVRSFFVKSPCITYYHGLRLGTGFVASHIWGKVNIKGIHMISSRHYMLNSFVPNLVWLPVQISKLTDREGSMAQRLLQVISHTIYREIVLPKAISWLWEYLPFPEELRSIKIDQTQMNYFVVSKKWIDKRVAGLISEINQISSIEDSDRSRILKIKSHRYVPTFREVAYDKKLALNDWLALYKALLLGSQTNMNCI
jgi:hypothetical protein